MEVYWLRIKLARVTVHSWIVLGDDMEANVMPSKTTHNAFDSELAPFLPQEGY